MTHPQKEKAAGENSGLFGTPNQIGNEMKRTDVDDITIAQKTGNPVCGNYDFKGRALPIAEALKAMTDSHFDEAIEVCRRRYP